MKKLFIPLILSGICNMVNGQITVSYSQIPFEPHVGSSASCNVTGNAYSFENRVSRSFFLTDFDIQNDFQIHKVSFAIQNVLFLPADGFPVNVNLYTSEGAYPNGELTLIGTADVVVTQDISHTIDVDMEALAPAGSEVVMEIHYNGEPINSALFIGANGFEDNAPAYIQAEACGINTPTEIGQIGGINNSRFLMSIQGEDTVLGITNIVNATEVSVFPNPVKDSFNLKIADSRQITNIDLFDLSGKKIRSYGSETSGLNITDLSKGVYLLKIQTIEGKVLTHKIIKN